MGSIWKKRSTTHSIFRRKTYFTDLLNKDQDARAEDNRTVVANPVVVVHLFYLSHHPAGSSDLRSGTRLPASRQTRPGKKNTSSTHQHNNHKSPKHNNHNNNPQQLTTTNNNSFGLRVSQMDIMLTSTLARSNRIRRKSRLIPITTMLNGSPTAARPSFVPSPILWFVQTTLLFFCISVINVQDPRPPRPPLNPHPLHYRLLNQVPLRSLPR